MNDRHYIYYSDTKKKNIRKKKNKRNFIYLIIFILSFICVSILLVIIFSDNSNNIQSIDMVEKKITLEEPREISSITIGATGDILIHMPVLDAFWSEEGYDFTPAFSYIKEYYEKPDLMIANLEVPLVDPNDGYNYSSNPFASPDSIAIALKNAGVDLCLTANNHSYDMGNYGLIRTQNILNQLGIDYIGTRYNWENSYVMVKTINEIKIGMTCFTYDTSAETNGRKSLNYNILEENDSSLVNSFNYSNLELFYNEAELQIKEMEDLNCDIKIFFLHWGEEYMDEPNHYQVEIAQKLCELGVDILIGGHPHVIQRFDTLNSSSGHQLLCLYSMGNALSNQRREYMNEDFYRGYTEDGLIIYLTIRKFNNGKTKIGCIEILPTWVEKRDSYRIIPLDYTKEPNDWKTFNTDSAIESYNRTISRLGDNYILYRLEHHEEEIPLVLP